MRSTRLIAAAAAVALAGSHAVHADTVAYLRFEEGPEGTGLTATAGGPTDSLAIDSAGGDDNFRTYNSPATEEVNFDTSPTYSSNVPTSVIPQTGAVNNFSFSFDGNDDIYQNDINSPISTTFDDGNQFTIEAFVYPTVTGEFDTFIGRDDFGDQGGNNEGALFYLQQRADTGAFAVIATGKAGEGSEVRIDSLDPVVADQWYHLAAVGDGTNMMFYVNGELQGTEPLASGLFSPDTVDGTGWTIGRGFYGGVTDWAEADIDEVRFSDVALDPSQFLNAPIPEPTTLALLPAIGLLAMRRRR